MFEESDRKLFIICSKGTMDMAYPGLILANAALMEGIEANIFFTFWGLDIITEKKIDKLKCTPLGNPSMVMPNGMGIPNIVGMLPGMTDISTAMMKREMAKNDFPRVREFLHLVTDSGAKLYACQMTYDMWGLTKEDLFEDVDSVVGAMEFLEMAEGAQVLFI
jgi:peroxiredoxin family protein